VKKYLLLLLLTGCIVNQEDIKTSNPVDTLTIIQVVPECREKTDVLCLLKPDGKTSCQFMEDIACHRLVAGEKAYSCVYYDIVDCDE